MAKNIDNLVKMILDSTDNESGLSGMGKVLHDFATNPISLSETNDFGGDELAQMVHKLRVCEAEGKLAWMDYSSWYNMNTMLQNKFSEVVVPLFCSSVFFDFTDLENNFLKVIKHIDSNVIYVTKIDNKIRKLICLSDNIKVYSMKSDSQFAKISKEIKENLKEIWYQKDGRLNIVTKDSCNVKQIE